MNPTSAPPIRRALLSVSDKTGMVDFARALHELGIELLSTGGTAKLLSSNGVPVIEVADYTGFPEMMDGRLKPCIQNPWRLARSAWRRRRRDGSAWHSAD